MKSVSNHSKFSITTLKDSGHLHVYCYGIWVICGNSLKLLFRRLERFGSAYKSDRAMDLVYQMKQMKFSLIEILKIIQFLGI